MTEFEHPIAIYYDDDGDRHMLRAEDLEDRCVFEKAKELTLFDGSEQCILLPRDIRGRKRHFYEPNPTGRRSVFGADSETSPIHDKRMEELYDSLVYLRRWKIGFLRGDQFEQMFDISGYSWDLEVHRIITADVIVRHDLFGQSQYVGMSVFRPWIAIEVIHTHYPEEKAFNAMLDVSRRTPLLVLFDNANRRNYFLKVDAYQETIRCSYYIYDGCVWRGDERTAIRTAAALKDTIEGHLRRLR